jgi:hypothetical protein
MDDESWKEGREQLSRHLESNTWRQDQEQLSQYLVERKDSLLAKQAAKDFLQGTVLPEDQQKIKDLASESPEALAREQSHFFSDLASQDPSQRPTPTYARELFTRAVPGGILDTHRYEAVAQAIKVNLDQIPEKVESTTPKTTWSRQEYEEIVKGLELLAGELPEESEPHEKKEPQVKEGSKKTLKEIAAIAAANSEGLSPEDQQKVLARQYLSETRFNESEFKGNVNEPVRWMFRTRPEMMRDMMKQVSPELVSDYGKHILLARSVRREAINLLKANKADPNVQIYDSIYRGLLSLAQEEEQKLAGQNPIVFEPMKIIFNESEKGTPLDPDVQLALTVMEIGSSAVDFAGRQRNIRVEMTNAPSLDEHFNLKREHPRRGIDGRSLSSLLLSMKEMDVRLMTPYMRYAFTDHNIRTQRNKIFGNELIGAKSVSGLGYLLVRGEESANKPQASV